ncbi:hypothetical protein LCGC14_2251250 [marine sediment metagenome]|uniref:Uncharacterized protein n=1 Tax=marine sediment metagenome TaxID=412755 RepID=A0A0F9FF24_9ZZZZ
MIESIRQSSLNQWARCGEQFYRSVIQRDWFPPGIAARIGTGLHKGTEVNHKAKRMTGKDEPLDVVQDAARDGYVKSLENGVFFSPEEAGSAKTQMAEGVDTTVSLAGLYHKELAPKILLPKYVEERIVMDVPGVDIPFSGIIDVYTDDCWLLDIKSAAKRWPEGKADQEIQPTMYNELIKHRTGSYPKKLSFEIFTKAKEPKYQPIETTRTPDDFKVLVQRAQIMMKSIMAGIFPPAQPGHWICTPKWCGYWWTCPHIPKHRKIIPSGLFHW